MKKNSINNPNKRKNELSILIKILKNNKLEIVLLIFIFLSIMINIYYYEKILIYSRFFQNVATDIVISIFPFVLTVLSISLSLPKDKIYGIEKSNFRKLEGAAKYSFNKMLIIALLIFLIYLFSNFFILPIVILVLSFISLIYSFVFTIQEIPLLMHSDKRIEKIIRNNVIKIYPKAVDEESDIDIVITNMLFRTNIKDTYNKLKFDNNEVPNHKILMLLLELQNNYLKRYIENFSEKFLSNLFEFKDHNIFDVLDKVNENILALLSFKIDFNLIEILGSGDDYYSITNALISNSLIYLNEILKKFNMKNKFSNVFNKILSNIFMEISNTKEMNVSQEQFYYKLLNNISIRTLSNGEIWFLEQIRDTFLIILSEKATAYMLFLTIYMYYLAKINPVTKNKFKTKYIKFIYEESTISSIYGNTWNNVLKNKLKYLSEEDFENLLSKLLNIYDISNKQYYIWSNVKQFSIRTTDTSFTKNIIFNWWLSFVLTSNNQYVYKKYYDSFELPNLTKENLSIMIDVFINEWNEYDEKETDSKLKIINFYNRNVKLVDIRIDLYEKMKEQFNKKKQKEMIDKYVDKDNEEIKQKFLNGFESSFSEVPFINTSLELDDYKIIYFNFTLQNIPSDQLFEMSIKQFPVNISQVICNEIINDDNIIKKKINGFSKNDLEKIRSFNPEIISSYILLSEIRSNELDDSTRKIVNDINKISPIKNIRLPRGIFMKSSAIQFNIECIEKKIDVRNFTDEEINTIIDRDFSLISGKYKYFEYANSKSPVLLNRDEIYNLILKKYKYISFPFKYRIKLDYDNIRYYQLEKEIV